MMMMMMMMTGLHVLLPSEYEWVAWEQKYNNCKVKQLSGVRRLNNFLVRFAETAACEEYE